MGGGIRDDVVPSCPSIKGMSSMRTRPWWQPSQASHRGTRNSNSTAYSLVRQLRRHGCRRAIPLVRDEHLLKHLLGAERHRLVHPRRACALALEPRTAGGRAPRPAGRRGHAHVRGQRGRVGQLQAAFAHLVVSCVVGMQNGNGGVSVSRALSSSGYRGRAAVVSSVRSGDLERLFVGVLVQRQRRQGIQNRRSPVCSNEYESEKAGAGKEQAGPWNNQGRRPDVDGGCRQGMSSGQNISCPHVSAHKGGTGMSCCSGRLPWSTVERPSLATRNPLPLPPLDVVAARILSE